MKKKRYILFAICLVIFLSACTVPKPIPTDTVYNPPGTETQETTSETAPIFSQQHMAAVSVPSVTETLTSDDGTVLFQYTYQNMSLILQDPDVADKVIIDFLNRIDDTRSLADDTAKMAQTAYNDSDAWVPYLYHIIYNPTRIDHDVLSLFGSNVLYSGAFHPDRTCVSANYDLVTGDVLTLASIMSVSATTDDFCQLVLDGLSEMSEKNYLYENYSDTVKQRFMTDSSQDEAWYFSQSGLCFYFAPYEIAPYSSGVITIEIPYEKLSGLIHDAYFPAERDVAEGTIEITSFEKTDLSNFSQIAEVIESKDGRMYLAYTETAVQDVRIIFSDSASSYTIFAAYGLTPGDAVMIQTSDQSVNNMFVSFKSNGKTVTIPFIK